MQTIKIELKLDGKKVTTGFLLLDEIFRSIPDIEENREIFDILTKSDNPDVRACIARNQYLSKKATKILLQDEDTFVVNSVLLNTDACRYIDEDMLLKLIESNNTKYLTTIAGNIKYFTKIDSFKLEELLSNHKNPSVRYATIRWRAGGISSKKILKKLSHDNDIDIAKEAQRELIRRD